MNKTWSFYDALTGQMSGVKFTGPASMLTLNIPAGSAAIEGEYDHLSSRVDLPTGTVIGWQPPKPADDALQTWSWSATTLRWVSSRTLLAVKLARLEVLKAEARVRGEANITVGVHEFEANTESRNALFQKWQIATAAVADGLPFSVDWTKANNTEVTLTALQVKAILRAIDSRNDQLRATYRTLRAQVQAATTVVLVEAVTWP